MRVNPFLMPVLVVALFGTTFSAQALGKWSTSGRVAIDPAKLTAADLNGWMTLQEVMDGLRISQADLYAAGKIPADVLPTTPLNKLESLVPGFSVTALREALSIKPSTSTTTTESAGTQTEPASQPTPVTPAPTPSSTPPPTTSATKTDGAGTGAGPTPLPAGEILPAAQIKGKMTLKDVSQQCGVSLDAMLQKLNLPASTRPATAIKDLIAEGKLADVTDVQAVVAEMQSK